jgi:hypothetical protein
MDASIDSHGGSSLSPTCCPASCTLPPPALLPCQGSSGAPTLHAQFLDLATPTHLQSHSEHQHLHWKINCSSFQLLKSQSSDLQLWFTSLPTLRSFSQTTLQLVFVIKFKFLNNSAHIQGWSELTVGFGGRFLPFIIPGALQLPVFKPKDSKTVLKNDIAEDVETSRKVRTELFGPFRGCC